MQSFIWNKAKRFKVIRPSKVGSKIKVYSHLLHSFKCSKMASHFIETISLTLLTDCWSWINFLILFDLSLDQFWFKLWTLMNHLTIHVHFLPYLHAIVNIALLFESSCSMWSIHLSKFYRFYFYKLIKISLHLHMIKKCQAGVKLLVFTASDQSVSLLEGIQLS